MEPNTQNLFQQLIVASGLADVLARSVLTRAITRAGVAKPEAMTRADLARALPMIEQALRVYLKPNEVEARLRDISALAR